MFRIRKQLVQTIHVKCPLTPMNVRRRSRSDKEKLPEFPKYGTQRGRERWFRCLFHISILPSEHGQIKCKICWGIYTFYLTVRLYVIPHADEVCYNQNHFFFLRKFTLLDESMRIMHCILVYVKWGKRVGKIV